LILTVLDCGVVCDSLTKHCLPTPIRKCLHSKDLYSL
jgi:hypothetical protein